MYAQLLRFGLPALLVLGVVLLIYRAGQDSIQKRWDAAVEKAELEKAVEEARRAKAASEIQAKLAAREKEIADRDATHQEQLRVTKRAADGVRDRARALARDTQATRDALQQRVAVLGRLYEESVGVGEEAAALLAEGSRGFGRTAAKLDALQIWDREVCR